MSSSVIIYKMSPFRLKYFACSFVSSKQQTFQLNELLLPSYHINTMFRQKDLLSVDTTAKYKCFVQRIYKSRGSQQMEFFIRNKFELHIILPKYNPCIQTFLHRWWYHLCDLPFVQRFLVAIIPAKAISLVQTIGEYS